MKQKTLRAIALICAATMLTSLPAFAEPAVLAGAAEEKAVSVEEAADAAGTAAETTDPASGATDPTSGATDPASGATDPASGAIDPASGATDPASGTTDPATDPASGATDPATDTTDPAADPAANAADPASGTTDPASDENADSAGDGELLPEDDAASEDDAAETEALDEVTWDTTLNGDPRPTPDFVITGDSQPSYVLLYYVLSESAKTVSVIPSINPACTNVEVKIPKTVKNPDNGVTYTVTAMPENDSDTGHAFNGDDFARIKSISFPDTMRTIPGNIFNWRHDKRVSESAAGLPCPQGLDYTIYNYPDSDAVVSSIPAFISKNYKDGCYYAGKCLVRVDPNYSGDLTVKKGTICILASALEGCKKIKKVTLPDSVEYIGMYAFANSSVTSVNLPKNLKVNGGSGCALQYGAFCGCTKLKTVTIQCKTLGMIPQACFFNCKALTGFDFSKTTMIWGWAFAGAFAKGTKLTIPNSVEMYYGQGFGQFTGAGISELTIDTKEIATKCFASCPNLTKVTLGQHVEQLGTYAFCECKSLSNDLLKGTKVKTIRHRSLDGTAMKELTVPSSVTSLEGGAFTNNLSLKTLNWYGPKLDWYTPLFALLGNSNQISSNPRFRPEDDMLDIFNDTPDAGGTAVETVNIYAGLDQQSYGYSIYQMLPSLKTVNIKYAVTEIPEQVFYGDTGLKTVTLTDPSKLKRVGVRAFALTGLEEATVLKGVTYDPYAFQGDKYLRKVVVEEGVTELGDFMFEKCEALEKVSLPESLKTVNWAAFKSAGSRASVYLPAALELVEDDAFASIDGADHGLTIIMAGDPTIETVHSLDNMTSYINPDPENDKVAIPSDVIKVYTSSGNNYQAYKAYMEAAGMSTPAEGALPQNKAELTYTGGIIEIGGKLDTSKVTLKVNGSVVPKTDYTLKGAEALEKPGIYHVDVKLDPEKYGDGFLDAKTISAVLLDTAAKKGPVYGVVEGNTLTFDVQVSRFISVAGGNRYKTAAEIAKAAFPTAPSEAILVTGENFPDALSANAYAGAKNAPVLMSKLKELPTPTKDLLTKTWGKSVKTVTIIGGGFDKKVESALKSCGVTTIKHIAGKNRYKTAEEVCKAGIKEGLWNMSWPVAVATGQTSADALAFSPWSYRLHLPILLAKNGKVSASTKELIGKFGWCIMLGSSSTVSDSCLSSAQKTKNHFDRLSGSNRYKTSLAIAEYFASASGYGNTAFADGTDAHFPDALVGGMLQGKLEAPIILTKPGQKDVAAFVKNRMNEEGVIDKPVYFLGWAAKGKSSEYGELTKLLKENDGEAVPRI